MHALIQFKRGGIFIVMALFLCAGLAYGQQIGGPYTADNNTMLLMHFDGDLTNESAYSADGEQHGNPSSFYYLTNPVSGLGQCLRIDNDSQTDQAYVTVADTEYLDLLGDWTIEGWVYVVTFGTGSSDWRWVPRLVIKTGDAQFWRPNYFVEMWGSDRFFSCGYQTESQDAWPQANSGINSFQAGEWYHMTFIRDTSRTLLMTIIHDDQRQLKVFSGVDYTSFPAQSYVPILTNQAVHIGFAGGASTDSYLDGFVDEIRISNVVREMPIPPVILNVPILSNQTSATPGYGVGANIFTLFSTTVQSAEVMYSTDGGATFNSASMSIVSGDSMSATIPQQPTGTVIDYYVKATDNLGMSATVPEDAESDSDYYSFGIYTPQTQTLDLGFEEGSGVPQDQSQYGNQFSVTGGPNYSTNAAVGTYSMYFEGDSSYIESLSPFLAGPTFTVDFWFNMDSLIAYRRMVSLGENTGSTNYMVFLMPDSTITAESSLDNDPIIGAAGLRDSLKLTTRISAETWYHVIYELSNDAAKLELRDSNDMPVESKTVGVIGPATRYAGRFRVGLLFTHTGYFAGYIDAVNVYNYPMTLVGIEPPDQSGIPLRYELSQNYPNPFNPSTEIRFAVPQTENVKLLIYDILGRKVKTVLDKRVEAGEKKVTWNGTNDSGQLVASGVYFYKLETDNYVKTKKLVLLR